MLNKCNRAWCVLLAACLCTWMTAAGAQPYPSKIIRIVVPFAPGGTTDIVGRTVAQKIHEALGQTVLVENIPGAGTMIGAERVAKSAPDGYTLLVATSTTFSTNPHLHKQMPYKIEDFAPISMLAKYPLVVGLHSGIPAKNVAEFVAYAKANPDKLSYGTTGRGSSSHLTGAMICTALGIKMQDVPYKGSGPALADLMGGSLPVYVDAATTSLPLHRAGKIRIIAQTGDNRSEGAADIPTFVELGYPKMVNYTLIGLFAPAGTPPEIIEKLNAAVKRGLESSDVRTRFTSDALTPEWTMPQRALEMFKADNAQAGDIIRTMGLEMR